LHVIAAGPREPPPDAMRQITMRLSWRRAHTSAPYVLSMALCAAAVAACGSGAGPASSGGSASSGGAAASATPSAAAAKVSLLIEVTQTPGAKAERWTLQCEPTGGTQPNAAAACHQLLTATRPFAPIPRGIMCPMVTTGEQTAVIRGTWFGSPVDETFSQLSGCAAMRWKELGQVFSPIH
jgi:Subtilisin inhibitor-like